MECSESRKSNLRNSLLYNEDILHNVLVSTNKKSHVLITDIPRCLFSSIITKAFLSSLLVSSQLT